LGSGSGLWRGRSTNRVDETTVTIVLLVMVLFLAVIALIADE
jgi:hypothetical protein